MTSAHSILDQYAKANFKLCGYHFLALEKFCTESLYSKEIQQRTAGNFIDSIPAWIQDARRMTIHGDAFQLNMVLGRIRRAAGLLCIEPLQALIFSLEKTSTKIYQEAYVASVWNALDQIEQLLTEAKEYLETMEAGKSYGA